MSILTKTAATLREQASRLEQAATAAPRSAQDLLRRFGPPSMHYRYDLDLFALSRDPSGLIRHAIKNAGIELGIKIGEKLQAEYKGLKIRGMDGLFAPCSGSIMPLGGMGVREVATYEAEVFATSRAELENLLQLAFRAGRESA